MNIRTPIIVSAICILAASNISADCNYPKKNFVVPSGSNATEAEMIEVMGKVKTYQADLGSYRNCLEDELKQVSPDLEAFADIEAMISEQLTGDTNEEYSNNVIQNLKRK